MRDGWSMDRIRWIESTVWCSLLIETDEAVF